jgi:hypothetical protein
VDRRVAIERFIWAALPALLAFTLYLPTLTHGVITDDSDLIVNNPYLARASGLYDLFTKDLWAASGLAHSTQYYRPLPMLSFWLQTQTLGSSVPWLRFGNVVVLASSALVLVALLRRQWPSLAPHAATLVACAWVAHPFHTEATIWLSGRFDLFLMLGALALLALNLSETRKWSVPLAFAAGLLCKEPAVVLLPVLGLQDYFGKRRLREEWPKAVAAVVVLLGYLLLRKQIGVIGAEAVTSSSPATLIQSYATLWAVFGRLLLIPVGFDVHHWYTPVAWPLAIGLLMLVGVAAALAVWRAARDSANTGLVVGLALAGLSLGPVALIGPNQQIFGDRFASLLVVGVAIAAPALAPLVRRGSLRASIQRSLVVIVIGGWSLLTLQRGSEWSSQERLMDSALREDDSNPHWRVLQSHQLLEQGNPAAAIEVLLPIASSHPKYYKIWNALCVAYLRTSQTAQGEVACRNALSLDQQSPTVWLNWASILVNTGRWREATDAAQQALQFRNPYPEAEYILAGSLAQLGQLDAAEEHVKRGLAAAPAHRGLQQLQSQLNQHKLR